MTRTAHVLVVSTRAASGVYDDRTGPVIAQWLRDRGFDVRVEVTADAGVADALAALLSQHPSVLLTTGGTGISPDDRTPEATRALLDAELPGIVEEVRRRGAAVTPTAVLSRAVAGIAGGCLVMNLPGSSGGVRDGLAVLDGVLDHVLDQLSGGDH
ncbi:MULTISPECIES: molybdenum cofactor biosynthesis protein B [unclassified Microbacterium]|uniref:MogA/MoaB family molybdenum cofactor biosynthesis protein n=1 Tax=unclassified Microbacterium TaxID=2609290 RepID=UPI000CFAE67D|nr:MULTISPECIES: MogA/MoaB family molybdenum cofactor biosynthesis protein [unclassified Microbacterium]PRB07434.1 molybdenum cofactor biosynthesis protein [Microbacterium sp. MYb72]